MTKTHSIQRSTRFAAIAALVGFGLLSAAMPANARPVVASDNASNAPYADQWQTGDNGGFGFGAWTLTSANNGGSAGHFIGTSNNNGNGLAPAAQPTLGINTAGVAFGLYANSGGTPFSLATRNINSAIAVGSTFSFGYDNGYVDSPNAPQIRLADSTGLVRLTFQFVGGGANYSVIDGGGTQNFGNGTAPGDLGGYTEGGLSGIFTLTGTDTYSLQMTRNPQAIRNSGEVAQTATISGTLAGTAGSSLTQLQIFTNAGGGGGTGDFLVNSFEVNAPATVVPEPGTLSLLTVGFGIVGMVIARRKCAK